MAVFITLLFIAANLQTTIVPELRLGGGPELVLLLVLCWGLLIDFRDGLIVAIIGGIFQDLASSLPLGTTTLPLTFAVGAVCLVVGNLSVRQGLIASLAGAAGVGVYHVAMLGVLFITGRRAPIVESLLGVTLPAMIMNFFIIFFIFKFVGYFFRYVIPKRVGGN
jgi:rod shape-determining protein MreD